MSMNYYLCRETLPQRWGTSLQYIEFDGSAVDGVYMLHLCKVTGMWKTLFQATPMFKTFEQLIGECARSIAEGAVIKDEYGTVVSLEAFKAAVLDYEECKKGKTIQSGVEFVMPISHIEYVQRFNLNGDSYTIDNLGKEFTSSVFS